MAGLYIHIPYCRHRCLYCDFFTGGASIARWNALADALVAELRARREELTEPLDTIYFGGGTPSMMPAEYLRFIFEEVRHISGERWCVSEATIEINPDDVSDDSLRQWLDIGFNRLSLGVQSLDDTMLRTIGRRHDAAAAHRAMELLAVSGTNMSVDLMFGLPSLTDILWKNTIKEVLQYRPHHLSAYALMYEPGTALTALRDAGRLAEATDEEYERQYLTLIETLSAAGYRHYETSNFALPGHHSRHNTLYWQGAPYIGIGPGAHSYDGRRQRRANSHDLFGYLSSPGRPPHDIETLTDEMLLDEYLLTRLRLAEGIKLSDFRRRFGNDTADRLIAAARHHSQRGEMLLNNQRLAIAPASIIIADTLIADIASSL